MGIKKCLFLLHIPVPPQMVLSDGVYVAERQLPCFGQGFRVKSLRFRVDVQDWQFQREEGNPAAHYKNLQGKTCLPAASN